MRGLTGQVREERAMGGPPTTPVGCQQSITMVTRVGVRVDEEGRSLRHTEASPERRKALT